MIKYGEIVLAHFNDTHIIFTFFRGSAQLLRAASHRGLPATSIALLQTSPSSTRLAVDAL